MNPSTTRYSWVSVFAAEPADHLPGDDLQPNLRGLVGEVGSIIATLEVVNLTIATQ